ncbi:MAG: polysaccharide deacetylase family protein [bacterium]|nr:polysaccharide deacetylase family protein [bacterium]
MKKVLGLGAFIAVCLAVCLYVDMSALKHSNTETYGEYLERVGKANEEETINASKAQKVDQIANERVSDENTKSKELNDSKEKEKKQLTKKAFLTFDDGPSKNTPKVLETLDKYNAKATFFMIGEQITPDMESLVKEMQQKGHVIGVHTYTHNRKKMYANEEACLNDIKKTYDRLIEVTGVTPTLYRFPYGSANCYISGYCNDVIRKLKDMGLDYVDWNVSGEDSVGKPSKYSIMKNTSKFKDYMEPVILLHDGQGNQLTAQVLDDILKKIKDAGYEFGTLDERSELFQWHHDWQKK